MITIPPVALVTLWFAVILGLSAGFFVFVRKLSGRIGQERQDTGHMLTKFRELHADGGLSDDEYRTIKTMLAPGLSGDVTPSTDTDNETSDTGSDDYGRECRTEDCA